MAAFPYPNHNVFFFEDPSASFLPNPHLKMPEFSEQPQTITTTFPQFYTLDEPQFHQIPINVSVHENSCFLDNNITNHSHSTDSSSVVHNKPPESTGESQATHKGNNNMDKKRKSVDGSSISSLQSKGSRKIKGKKQKKCNISTEGNDGDQEDKNIKQAPEGYIHVRARRGQATDSHSLAERVRREKISERMKLLQSLVPGCEKVSGKALMLDEIITYVQSLQYQVEFLSMKLTSMDPMLYNFAMGMDAFMVTPERLNGLVSPLQNHQDCNLIQPAPLLETTSSSSSGLFQQEHMPDILPQDNRQLLWDVDEQRQKQINQSGFTISNLCSFH